MKKWAILLILTLSLVQLAVAQYSITYTNPIQDMTGYITTGTNTWQYLPGNPQCELGTGSITPNHHVWCVGTNHDVFEYVPKTKTWTDHTAMGKNVKALAVGASNQIYSLQNSSDCSPWPPDMGFFQWTGSAWNEPVHALCFSQISITRDGYLSGVDHNAGCGGCVFYAKTSNLTGWTEWATSGWSFVSMFNSTIGCGINTSGVAYELGFVANSTPTNLGNPSTHPLTGCVPLPLDAQTIVWDSTGKVWLDAMDNTGWHSVSGLTLNQIIGVTKGNIVALDSTGKPYHLAVYAPSLTVTSSGTWNSGCPGPGQPCHSGATHSLKAQVTFPNGKGINNGAGMQETTMAWNAYGSVHSWDTLLDPNCDPFYGDPSAPECIPNTGGGNECNQSNQGLGSPQPLYGEGESTWYLYQTDLIQVAYSNLISPLPGTYQQTVYIPVQDACIGGIPTCKNIPQINVNPPIWDLPFVVRTHDPLLTLATAQAIPHITKSWVLESYYQIDPYLAPQCFPKDIRPQDAADDGICD